MVPHAVTIKQQLVLQRARALLYPLPTRPQRPNLTIQVHVVSTLRSPAGPLLPLRPPPPIPTHTRALPTAPAPLHLVILASGEHGRCGGRLRLRPCTGGYTRHTHTAGCTRGPPLWWRRQWWGAPSTSRPGRGLHRDCRCGGPGGPRCACGCGRALACRCCTGVQVAHPLLEPPGVAWGVACCGAPEVSCDKGLEV